MSWRRPCAAILHNTCYKYRFVRGATAGEQEPEPLRGCFITSIMLNSFGCFLTTYFLCDGKTAL